MSPAASRPKSEICIDMKEMKYRPEEAESRGKISLVSLIFVSLIVSMLLSLSWGKITIRCGCVDLASVIGAQC